MSDTLQKEKKKVFTFHLKNSIEKEEWKKLVSLLPVAEEVEISTTLLRKGWILAGEYLAGEKDWTNAIISYNKARVKNPSTIYVFDKLINAFGSFYEQFKDKFSKADLKILKDPLFLLIDYYQLNYPKHQAHIEVGKELIQKINYRMKYVAEEKIETPATFKVEQIHNAIYDDMTFEELQSEFARIIEPTIRDILEEKDKETKKKKDVKSKKGKKKK